MACMPKHTPKIDLNAPNSLMMTFVSPASFGMPGPGEIKILSKSLTKSSVTKSFRLTTISTHERSFKY